MTPHSIASRISYLCLAFRFSQIVLNVGAVTAFPAAGFLAVDFAVGGGFVGFDFLDLFNCNDSFGVNQISSRRAGLDRLLYAGLRSSMKGI